MMDMNKGIDDRALEKKKVKRILLDNNSATNLERLVTRLRKDSCKTDASKVVNQILELFFNKNFDQEYRTIKEQFFDKKKYLKNLFDQKSDLEIDESISQYLQQNRKKKRADQKIHTKRQH